MSKSTNYYFITPAADYLDFIDFGLNYGSITTVGDTIQFNGTSKIDSIFVRPGMSYDLSNTGPGADKIYLGGNLADYTVQISGLNMVLSRTASGLLESVTVASGTATAQDKLVFANGTVKTNELADAIKNASATPVPNPVETSVAPSGAAVPGAPLNAVLKAFATGTSTAGHEGQTFATTKPGISFIVTGGAGIDTVYVANGEVVDATALGQSVDLVYMRGTWADYTKTVLAGGTKLQFTRQVDGNTESVTVLTGTVNQYDKLIFADGAVTTINTKNALVANPAIPITGVTGNEPSTTTPLYSDEEIAAALNAIQAAAQNNSATDTTPSAETYAIAGIQGLTSVNLAAIISALNSMAVDGSKADTAAKVQAIVSDYSAILASADGTPGNTATPLTAAQYTDIGVTGVSAGSALNLLDNVVDGKANTAVDTVAEVQALADAANAVQSQAAGNAGLTMAQLTLLGITGPAGIALSSLNASNQQAILNTISATADDGSAVNSVAKLQALINSADITAPTLQTSNPGDEGLIAASSNLRLTFSEAVQLGSTGVVTLKSLDGGIDVVIDVAHNAGQLSTNGNVLTINPSSDLAFSKKYAVQIQAGVVKDLIGNDYAGIGDITSLNFTTLAQGGAVSLEGTPVSPGRLAYNRTELDPPIALGDVNGDGFDDFGFTMNANLMAGLTTVVLGRQGGINSADISNAQNGIGGFLVTGLAGRPYAYPDMGFNSTAHLFATGDVNGDGLSDYALGFPYWENSADGSGSYDNGILYFFYGKAATVSASISNAAFSITQSGYDARNAYIGMQSGSGATFEDVNGDGISDILLSVNNGYVSYVTYGKAGSANANLDLTSFDPASGAGLKIMNSALLVNPAYGNVGSKLAVLDLRAVGDVNGDGRGDFYLNTELPDASYVSYVVFGKSGGGTIDVAHMTSAEGFRIMNNYAYSSNAPAKPLDFNGDGLSDFVCATQGWGSARLILGKTDTETLDANYASSHLIRIQPTDDLNGTMSYNAGIGAVDSAGDVNGDGMDDLLVTEQYDDALGPDAGRIFVVFGRSDTSTIQLSDVANGVGGFAINPVSGTWISNKATGAGDLNGDGFADLLFTDVDKVYVLLGGRYMMGDMSALVQGSGVVNGSADSEVLIGSAGNDTLSGGGGVDRIFAGAGNDTMVLTASDTSQLSDNTATGSKACVDGGGGIDTLRLTGGATLDLTLISNAGVGAAAPLHSSRISAIEKIDLATDAASNRLNLGLMDVLDMTGMNQFNSGNGWSGLGATVSRHQLVIDGGSNDSVGVTGNWTNAGTAVNNGHTYSVYNNSAAAAQLLVDTLVEIKALGNGVNHAPTIDYPSVGSGANGLLAQSSVVGTAIGGPALEYSTVLLPDGEGGTYPWDSVVGWNYYTPGTSYDGLPMERHTISILQDYSMHHNGSSTDPTYKQWRDSIDGGTALNGGNFAVLNSNVPNVGSPSFGYTGMQTKLTGLVAGQTYVFGLQWQQMRDLLIWDGQENDYHAGGQLVMSVNGHAQIFTSSGLNDSWNNALYSFTATSSTENLQVYINGLTGMTESPYSVTYGWALYGGAIAVDSLSTAQVMAANPLLQGAGASTNTLFGSVTDTDTSASLKGWAITSAATDGAGHHWQYSSDQGASWHDMDSASAGQAIYLATTDLIHWTGLKGTNTELDARAVDNTGPALHASNAQAGTVDTTQNGGSTAYSGNTAILVAHAPPLLLDLNHDGAIEYSQIDMSKDGQSVHTAWVGPSDGLLFWDKYADATLHSSEQYVFGQNTGNDLNGLRAMFDSNNDFQFNAKDAQFGQFGVWQDANQNGNLDAGEYRTLSQWGIAALTLTSTDMNTAPAQGVNVVGCTTATLVQGELILVVDANFEYAHLPLAAQTSSEQAFAHGHYPVI